jgi:glycosidase
MGLGLRILVTTGVLMWSASVCASAQSIERIDPPHWWSGFQDSTVQLVVYGQDVASLELKTPSEGVDVLRSETTNNPNYLFLDLSIQADAPTGELDLEFHAPDGSTLSYSWAIKHRQPGSANRDGFDSSDTVYLADPDRFANGDPGNDTIEGYVDVLNRSDPGGRHGGDLQGLIEHLDYIEQMGFTQLWLNPVLENAEARNSYHGYAITDHYRVDPRLGDNALYRHLSEAADERGIGLIKDVVLNHAGSNHFLFQDLPDRNWFNNDSEFFQSSYQHTTAYDPYRARVDHRDFVDGWFAPTMPDFNQREDRVAQYLIDHAIWWIEEAGLSGLRLDTYDFPDQAFLDRFMARIQLEYPNLSVVGEAWAYDPAVIAPMQTDSPLAPQGQPGVPQLMDFPLQIKAREALLASESWNEGLIALYQFMINDRLYGDPHDMMVFVDNHDFDRMHTQMGEDIALTKMALTYALTTRGIPQILYGTELLFTNDNPGDHGEIREDFPGGWPADDANRFTGEGLTQEQAMMQSWIRKLINWRKTSRAVHHGDYIHFAPLERYGTQSLYAFASRNEGEGIFVVLNKSEADHELDVDLYGEVFRDAERLKNVMTDEIIELSSGLTIPARGAVVFEIIRSEQ